MATHIHGPASLDVIRREPTSVGYCGPLAAPSRGSTIPDTGQFLRLEGFKPHLEQPRTIHELNFEALVASPSSRYCAIQISA